jgi:hypothetical protein
VGQIVRAAASHDGVELLAVIEDAASGEVLHLDGQPSTAFTPVRPD